MPSASKSFARHIIINIIWERRIRRDNYRILDVSGEVTIVSGFVWNAIIGVVFARRGVVDGRWIKGAESAFVRVEYLKEFRQRRGLEVEAQFVLESPSFSMNDVFRVENAG